MKKLLFILFCFSFSFVFTISGDSFAATASLSPTNKDYGNVAVGSVSATQTFTITYTGPAAGNLTVTSVTVTSPFVKVSDGCTGITIAAPGGSCTFGVTYIPTAIGSSNGTATVVTNATDGTNKIATLAGIGVGGPVVVITPSTPPEVDFGNVTVGTSALQTFTVSNSGPGSLIITNVTVSGAPFFKVSDDCNGEVVAPLGSCNVIVQYFPTAVTTSTGSLTVTCNASNGNTHTEFFVGTGVSSSAATASITPTTFNYGSVAVGSSVTQDFIITNTGGSGTLSITSATVSAAPFLKTADNCTGNTLLLLGTCTITVAYNPTLATFSNAVLTVVTNAANGTNKITALMGMGTSSNVVVTGTISPTFFDYGTVSVGSTGLTTFTITNTSVSGSLTISSATIPSIGEGIFVPFLIAADNCTGQSLPPGGTCTIDVVFTPTTSGSFAETLTVVTNAGNGTNKVASFIGNSSGSGGGGNNSGSGGGCSLCQPSLNDSPINKEGLIVILLAFGILLRSRVRKISR